MQKSLKVLLIRRGLGFLCSCLLLMAAQGCGIQVHVSRDEVEGIEFERLYNGSIGCGSLFSGTCELTVVGTLDRDQIRTYDLMVDYWDQSLLFIERGEGLVLNVDGALMRLAGDGSAGSRDFSPPLPNETAWFPISYEQLADIANAREVKVKVVGSKGIAQGCLNEGHLERFRKFLLKYPPHGGGTAVTAAPRQKLTGIGNKKIGALSADLRTRQGRIVVASVWPNGHAAKAGLLAGDVVTAVGGQPAGKASGVMASFRSRLDQAVPMEVERGGGRTALSVPATILDVAEGTEAEDAVRDLLVDGNRASVAVMVGTVNNLAIAEDQLPGWRATVRERLMTDEEGALLNRFGKDEQFSLVERARLKDLFHELALQQTGAVSEETRLKLGRLTGATHLMVVELTRSPRYGSSVDHRVHRLIDIETGKTVAIGEMNLPGE